MSIISITLAYVLGIKWGLYQDVKILVGLLIFLLICTLIFNKDKFNMIIILCVVCACGFSYSKTKFNRMNVSYIENEYKMRMTILSHESISSSGYSYKYTAKNDKGHKFIIYIKLKEENLFNIGDKILIRGNFIKPDVARNGGGFDYQKYLYSNNIYGTINCSEIEVISNKTKNIAYIIQNKIRENMLKVFDRETAGILIGMLIGETNDILESTQENFKTSGITHLLAVSGANVMLIISISNFLFSKIVGRKYDYIFSISFIILFTFVAGSSPSVVRAATMSITNIVLNLLLKKSNPLYTLSFSVFIITIYNPLAIENIGLILSVFGTLGIILLSRDLNKVLGKYISNKLMRETASVTISAQVFLLPIMAYYFNNISVISLLSNLIIVPIAESLSVIALCEFCISLVFIPLAKFTSILPKLIVKYILVSANFCAEFNFLNLTVPTPTGWMILIFYVILFLEYRYLSLKHSIVQSESEIQKLDLVRKNFYKGVGCLLIIFLMAIAIPKNYVEMTAIDVGQGDAFLITTTDGRRILIDGGGSERGDYDVGEKVLLPYMLDNCITTLDAVFISHSHADHIEGVYTLIENLKINQIFISAYNENNEYTSKLKSLCTKYKVPIKEIYRGDKIVINGVEFELLYPGKDVMDENENNLSMLLKVKAKDSTILFTGDLEKEAEEKLYLLSLKADILKVSHHGSKTSTTQEFLDIVDPDISIISVAEDNSFGHPNEEVLRRLRKCSKVYMTKDLGEINIKIYKNKKIKIDSLIK